jgi:hypothetical protein
LVIHFLWLFWLISPSLIFLFYFDFFLKAKTLDTNSGLPVARHVQIDEKNTETTLLKGDTFNQVSFWWNWWKMQFLIIWAVRI